MRVLFLTLAVFGPGKKGGGERYVSELAGALRAKGIEVPIMAVPSITSFFLLKSVDEVGERSSLSELWREIKKSDVVHVHQLNSPGFDYALAFAHLLGKPIVLTDHGGGALTLGRALGAARLRFVDAAGFVSAWSANDVDPRNSIQLREILWGGGDHLPKQDPDSERYDFGFVGRLLPHKGVHVLLQALPYGATAIVAGQRRDTEYYDELLRLAEGKNVTFSLDIDDGSISKVYRSIKYLVVPSVEEYQDKTFVRPELLGLVALEALAAGTPVIGSSVGGLGELLAASGQTHVHPGDVDAWSTALTTALRNEPLVVNADAYTWSAVADRCISLYDRVNL